MLRRVTGGLLVFVSDRDSVFFRGSVILAGFRAVWPLFCPVQTPVFSEISLLISESRGRREEIWASGSRDRAPTLLRRRQQGFRIVEGRIVRGGLERFFRAACSFFLCCRS